MIGARAVPVLLVAVACISVPYRLSVYGPATSVVPKRRGVRLLHLLCVLQCLLLPCIVLISDVSPCWVGYVTQFLLPAITSSIFLVAETSIVLLRAFTHGLLVYKDPPLTSSPTQTLRFLQRAIAPPVCPTVASVLALASLAPYVALHASVPPLCLNTCQSTDAFQTLRAVQVGHATIWGLLAGVLARYHRRERAAFAVTLLGLLGTYLCLVLSLVIPSLVTYHVGDAGILWLHFLTLHIGFPTASLSQRHAAPKVRTFRLRSHSIVDDPFSTVQLEDLQSFLLHSVHFDQFLAHAVVMQRVTELLTWHLVQHYKAKRVSIDVVYTLCLAPHGVLASQAASALGPRIAAFVNKPHSDIADRLLDTLLDKLLRVLINDVLPSYRDSSPTWDTYLHRSNILRDCTQPGGSQIPESISATALRATSDLESGGRAVSSDRSGSARRAASILSPASLGLSTSSRPRPPERQGTFSTRSIMLTP
ncbi:hypothetical protein SDRG_14067 [Saprolegnia diclina VS20]|uniref:RGS domain-containing protein n=1 Tax=Saprolegnia diclina (strain VS20) TaxID=1156394 RepID=T0PRX0_SAPDV|nr:hypothetical protein SDRG_14067 [Saprolegnia diclina VS20]EQC28244.1 hypothetical protein SDRG_14067 [Saprolegnia diclina VS20]|eukprot:XP_008618393.1 hypothetical protein SDRG_14067 [Saprolegnia diclina VS20]